MFSSATSSKSPFPTHAHPIVIHRECFTGFQGRCSSPFMQGGSLKAAFLQGRVEGWVPCRQPASQPASSLALEGAGQHLPSAGGITIPRTSSKSQHFYNPAKCKSRNIYDSWTVRGGGKRKQEKARVGLECNSYRILSLGFHMKDFVQ